MKLEFVLVPNFDTIFIYLNILNCVLD